jgi:CRISPR/Cas system-associated endonuclease Cas1
MSELWCGEESVRFYAQGLGETRSAARILWQAEVWASPVSRLKVATAMYRLRFQEDLPAELTIAELRGHEGVRVRTAYQQASAQFGVVWEGRNYQRTNWQAADPVNGPFPLLTAVCMASATLPFYRQGSLPLSASFIRARCSPSCTTLPTFIKPN